MMIKSSIEKLAYSIAFDIGNSSDVEQADLLNGLFAGLRQGIPAHRNNDLQTQLCYIAAKLDKNAQKLVKELKEFIDIKNEREQE